MLWLLSTFCWVPLSVICEKSRLKWLQFIIFFCQKTKFGVEEDFDMLSLSNKIVNSFKSFNKFFKIYIHFHIESVYKLYLGLFWPAGKRGRISQVICLAHNSNCHSNHLLFIMLLTNYSFSRPSCKSGSILDVTVRVIKFFLKSEW